MGKYYCDYCDIYLTHDSMNARKAHNTGRNHVSNVRDYFAGLGHDKAQNIIDQIVLSHEGGGRAQMMAAPSMRIGAGFMNPMAAPPMNFPPFPGNAPPPPGGGGYPAQSVPPFRPPFPPNGAAGSMPPFPPPQNMSGPPMGMPPPMGQMPPFSAGPPANGGAPQGSGNFTPQSGPPPAGNPGVHPDRLRMMGM
ncbi:U1 zinc finger-domain-containing protein [Kockovaella imperatae]|uniref:U1 small nuclear ribonucleoprotein C n=1 Tax=Kockovaella imperatae TaxID=4999 RepID=A0A1Y1UDK2_9TREE|nr:U1 zinc finger-domain-containing protein [Kockovaella imperatae]ORX35604.1 U1 zinc finger-domain-containing protein [Kockovaella imperatae]